MTALSATTIKSELPANVATYVTAWMKEHGIRKCGFRQMAGSKLYFGEDCTYKCFIGSHESTLTSGGEWNGYKAKDPINTYTDVPQGAFVVETQYFMGHPVISVMHWGIPAIGG